MKSLSCGENTPLNPAPESVPAAFKRKRAAASISAVIILPFDAGNDARW